MANLMRLRVSWSGSGVTGPGLSTFYKTTTGSVGWADDVLDFFSTHPLHLPSTVTVTVPSSGELINDATGELTGTWAEPGTGGSVTGSNAAAWAMGVGMRVRWGTGGIVGGRRVVGTTFIVPLPVGAYQTDGTIVNSIVTERKADADALIAARPEMVIVSKPTATRAGTSNAITEALVPDFVSWLRSRRT